MWPVACGLFDLWLAVLLAAGLRITTLWWCWQQMQEVQKKKRQRKKKNDKEGNQEEREKKRVQQKDETKEEAAREQAALERHRSLENKHDRKHKSHTSKPSLSSAAVMLQCHQTCPYLKGISPTVPRAHTRMCALVAKTRRRALWPVVL